MVFVLLLWPLNDVTMSNISVKEWEMLKDVQFGGEPSKFFVIVFNILFTWGCINVYVCPTLTNKAKFEHAFTLPYSASKVIWHTKVFCFFQGWGRFKCRATVAPILQYKEKWPIKGSLGLMPFLWSTSTVANRRERERLRGTSNQGLVLCYFSVKYNHSAQFAIDF